MNKNESDLNKGKPLCYLNEKGEESLAFFHANDNKNNSKLILSAERRSKKEEDWFSVPKHLTYEPNNNFEKKNAQFFFNVDVNLNNSYKSRDDSNVDTSVFDDISLNSIKHTYKVLNTPGFARPILGFKKRTSRNIVNLAENLNLKILIDSINATGILNFDKGLTEQEINNAEKMASKIDEILASEIKNNPGAKAALISKNIVDTLGTSAHYAIKLNNLIHTTIAGTIQNKIADALNIPNSSTTLEDRTIDLTKSIMAKCLSDSLKNSDSELIKEYSRALDSQFKSTVTNVPLHILEKSNNNAKGLFLFSQVMLINELKTLEKSLDKIIDDSKLETILVSPKGLKRLHSAPNLFNVQKKQNGKSNNDNQLTLEDKKLCNEKLKLMSTPTAKLKRPLSDAVESSSSKQLKVDANKKEKKRKPRIL